MPGVLTDQPPEVEGKAPPSPSSVAVASNEEDMDEAGPKQQMAGAVGALKAGEDAENGGEEGVKRCPFHRSSSSPESGESN